MQNLNEACADGRTTQRQTMFVMSTEFLTHSAKEIKDLFLTTKIFGRKILITIWTCTHHTHLFRPTCLIINTCDQNWRENARLPLAYVEIFPMDFPTLPYALIFSITGIVGEVVMVANDRGTECCCCCVGLL